MEGGEFQGYLELKKSRQRDFLYNSYVNTNPFPFFYITNLLIYERCTSYRSPFERMNIFLWKEDLVKVFANSFSAILRDLSYIMLDIKEN